MGPLIGILALLCFVVAFVAFIWLVVVIFQDGGVLWGLCSLFVPFVGLVYVIMNWGDRVKKPFLLQLGAAVAGVICVVVGGLSLPSP